MFNRRTVLGALFSLGGLIALLSACRHRAPYAEEERSTGGKGAGNGGGY